MQLSPGILAKVLPPSKHGSAQIVIDAPDLMTRLRANRDGQPLHADKYARLLINGSVWMTDAEFECATNRQIIRVARGSVLIAGLGLGLIVRPILDKKGVTSVTVLEINADVVNLVAHHYDDDKLTVTKADVYKWRSAKQFDTIYFDIFQNVPNSDDRADIDRLKRRYRKNLKAGGWMGAWCEEFAR